MRYKARSLAATFLAVVWLLALPAVGHAGYVVTVDTSGLSAGYTYAIDFQFALGGSSTLNDAVVNGITFGAGGSAGDASTIQTTGDVAGDLQDEPITLSGDQGGYAEFLQSFTPGSQLQFGVNVGNMPQTDGGLDTFTFAILYYDSNGNLYNIATDNPNFNDAFVEIDTGSAAFPSTIASQSVDPTFPVPTSEVTAVTLVPEPGALCLFLCGFSTVFAIRWRKTVR